ncbi:MAG: cupin domain-containing protein [Opitutaceae bacterium]|jgi:glucose-6-phosphate isomerase|nr:cupin domain-containing protein [Opitutaceae bacterium]
MTTGNTNHPPPPCPLASIARDDLFVRYTLESARLGNRPMAERRLADLRGCFADEAAFEAALARGNPLLYSVSSVEPASGDGQLHYGLGILQPGKIGAEYYMTKGHVHAHRPAAEIYIGLAGEGAMLLEDEASGESRLVPLTAHSVVYVPGRTAHRTVNTGAAPLVYIGVYPSNAGHDYAPVARNNFRQAVIERDGKPVPVPRSRLQGTSK